MIRTAMRNALSRIPFLRPIYRRSRDFLQKRDSFRITPWGFEMAGNPTMALGKFEPLETRQIRRLLGEIDILVNVGANIGYYCCHALSQKKEVIAVEPVISNIRYLLANIKKNGWELGVKVFPVALGRSEDIMSIWGDGTGASLVKGWGGNLEQGGLLVPVHTLDGLLGSNLNSKRALILMDVEGFEYEVLLGAARTLTNEPRPIWFLEITTNQHQPDGVGFNPKFVETFKLFFNNGYCAFKVSEDEVKVTMEDVNQWANGARSLDVHNFIFR